MQHKFQRNWCFTIILLLSTFAVQSCSTLGYENVDTTRKAILVATAEVRAANLLLQDLIRRNAISNNDAQNTLSNLRAATGNLQTALSAIDAAGDPALARSNLNRANVAITLALTLLSQFTEEP